MRSRFIALTALGLLVATSVHAERAKRMPSPATLTTAEFVRQAAISDMFETQSSELAAIRAEAPERIFAAKMNEDHQKTSSELHMLIKPHWRTTPIPPRLDPPHQAKIAALKTLHGAAFSRQYRTDQIAAHRAAVALFTRYANSGQDAALRSFAVKTLPKLRMHLEMAGALPISGR